LDYFAKRFVRIFKELGAASRVRQITEHYADRGEITDDDRAYTNRACAELRFAIGTKGLNGSYQVQELTRLHAQRDESLGALLLSLSLFLIEQGDVRMIDRCRVCNSLYLRSHEKRLYCSDACKTKSSESSKKARALRALDARSKTKKRSQSAKEV